MPLPSRSARIQAGALALGLGPLAVFAATTAWQGFGANPIEDLTHLSGEWALRFLLLCLAVTPARRWLGWSWAAPLRRTFGLIAYGYASLHVSIWSVLDLGLEPAAMWEDIVERRYIAAGLVAFLLLTPLAATSTRGMIRRLGRRWLSLHRLVYAAAIAAVVHFVWLVKADLASPLAHAAVLGLLLAARAVRPARVPAAG